MYIPKGYTEEEILKLIDDVVIKLAHHFVFSYYEIDDMIQEGRIFALEALPRYNPKNKQRCSLTNFLRIHVRNRFINLQRNKYYRQQPPCNNCEYYDNDCVLCRDEETCERLKKWLTINSRKKDLAETSEGADINVFDDFDIDKQELFEYIERRIPMELRGDFLRLIEGVVLAPHRRKRLINTIIDILADSPYMGV